MIVAMLLALQVWHVLQNSTSSTYEENLLCPLQVLAKYNNRALYFVDNLDVSMLCPTADFARPYLCSCTVLYGVIASSLL